MKLKNYISSFGTLAAKTGQASSKYCGVLSLGTLLLGAASATALTVTPLGVGKLPSGDIVLTAQFVLEPGDVVPWHYHSGYGWATIISGTLTLEDGCGGAPEEFTAGASFKEKAGIVHTAYNAGTVPMILLWTEIFPACQEPTIYVDGPSCSGKSSRPHPVKIPRCP